MFAFRPTLVLFTCLLTLSSCTQDKREPTHKLQLASIGLNTGAISNDARFAIAGSIHHGISLWRLKDEERLFNWNHKANIKTTLIAADFSPDGKWALTADTHTLVLWNVKTGEATRFWRAPGDILSVQLSRNGATALLGLSDHTAVLFDIQKGGVLRTLNHNNRVRSIALADNGKLAVTGSEDYMANAWNLGTSEVISKQTHEDDVQLVAVSPDGELALSVSKYDKAIVWKTDSGKVVGEVPLKAEHLNRGLRYTSARFSADNQWLLTGRPDQIITLWQLPTLNKAQQWRIPKKSKWKPTSATVLDVAFSKKKNQYHALASDGFLYTLDAKITK